jgi:uncharacterized protein YbbC (DUF1343 family)
MKKIIQNHTEKIVLGCENLLADYLDLVKGRRLGLITNPTGADSHLISLIDLFHENPFIDLVALYAPEHGIRGNVQAGQTIPFYRDEKYNLPVFSLYGQSLNPDFRNDKDLDERMRFFDTIEKGKIPDKTMLENVDIMVYDIQDIGTRIYTYMATMAYCMRVCAELGIEFIVMDRPNPINGRDMEGPILDYPEYSSFVGLYPIPVRHGMTIGELARLFNDRFLPKKVLLTVIPMKGWRRGMWHDQTGLPWVFPSPNIPTLQTATVYPGQVFLEGTNISEGRGTAKPFELFGAPWMKGQEMVGELNRITLPGVKFRETWFSPLFSKFKDELCSGAQLHIKDRNRYQPLTTTLHIIKSAKEIYPKKFKFYPRYFDLIIGTSHVRKSIEKGDSVDKIVREYSDGIRGFSRERKPYLMYDDLTRHF